MGPLRNGAGSLVTQGMAKAEVLDAFFTAQTSLQDSWPPETMGEVWSMEDLERVEDDQAKGGPKQMGHSQIHGTWQGAPTSAEGAGKETMRPRSISSWWCS